MAKQLSVLGILMLFAIIGCTQVIAAGDSSDKEATTPIKQIAQAQVTYSPPPTAFPTPITQPQPIKLVQTSTCPQPAGWYPYQVQTGETAETLAVRLNVTLVQLLQVNCLAQPTQIMAGSVVYVPTLTANNTPNTILPLGISAMNVEPTLVSAGGKVRVNWQTQGPVQNVRVGWVYNNQFIEVANNLIANTSYDIDVPSDGRQALTLMVRVGDGQQEVAAQTTIQVQCPEGFFFSPAPIGCPTAPMMTTFEAQSFERGMIIYIPALGINYLIANGQPVQRIVDSFVPGMPMQDQNVAAPEGLSIPRGAIYYAWRQSNYRTVLGFATAAPVRYMGMYQRTVDSTGETHFLMNYTGQVFQFRLGQVWNLITPS